MSLLQPALLPDLPPRAQGRPAPDLIAVLRRQLWLLHELAVRYEVGTPLPPPAGGPAITSPLEAAALLGPEMAALPQEQLRVLLLDTKNRVLRQVVVALGSLNTAQARQADLFREAVRDNAAALIIAHNHPTGDSTPSADDLAFTRTARAAGRLLGIDVLDHLVIGRPGWTSIRQWEGWPAG